jgi:hypothetical protein
MVRMLDIIAEYLKFRRFPFQRLDGSIKGEIRRQALDHFNKEDSEDFCFLLSTRAGGLGINLATADTVIIYDSDWNPQNDLQAQARAHRIGQKNQVNIYRLVSKNSIEEDIVERAKQKMVLDHLVIQRMDTTGRTVLNKTNNNSSIPFNKEEINSILKFGAEELFKEKEPDPTNATTTSNNMNDQEEKEENQLYDIDEILKRAETREETNHLSATEELLSQFKVANFSTMEDEPINLPATSSTSDSHLHQLSKYDKLHKQLDEKSWNEIIPEAERQRINEEEETERLRLLHNFESSRRRTKATINKNNEEDEDNYNSQDDLDLNSTDSEMQDKKSSSKNKKSKSSENQHTFKGLNVQEVRKFVRSYRKFPSPLNHIDTIAQDANLVEKSQAILLEFAQKLRDLCKSAITQKPEINTNNNQNSNNTNKSKEKGPSLEINGVNLVAHQILETETYFEPLTHFYSQLCSNGNDENSFQFKTKLKQTYWDCEWDSECDKALLRGIYEYGYGNWEWIKADPELKLGQKILLSDNSVNDGAASAAPSSQENNSSQKSKLKPQSKHLRTRIDYLIKVLQNQMNTEKYGANWRQILNINENNNQTSSSSKRENSENILEIHIASKSSSKSSRNKQQQQETLLDTTLTNNNNNNESSSMPNQNPKSKRKLKHVSSSSEPKINDSDSENQHSDTESKKKRHKEEHHHHHNSDSDHEVPAAPNTKKSKQQAQESNNSNNNKKEKKIILDEKTFAECKDILRPVKKALKNIYIIEDTSKEKDHLELIQRYLLEIGDKINDYLTMYSDPEKINKWRNYLWVFVSKFTSSWTYERIKNLYKKFAKSRDEEIIKNSNNQDPFSSDFSQNNKNNINSNNKNGNKYGRYSMGGNNDNNKKYSNNNNSNYGNDRYTSKDNNRLSFDVSNNGNRKEVNSNTESKRNYGMNRHGNNGDAGFSRFQNEPGSHEFSNR